MKRLVLSLPEALSASLTQLAGNRWNLLLMLLALDAVFHPYTNLYHDAQLYAVQVLNRLEGGFYDTDLYFSYGNQDRYSLFSLVMAPVVAGLGLKVSFFLVYLASKALFLYGAIRLFEALVADRRASTLALLFLAVTPIPYGGTETFHVNESFLTPRLTAAALVLLGLECLLAGRLVFMAVLLLAALALHPLMAFGGVLVAGLYLAARYLPARALVLLGVTAAIAAGVVLVDRDLGVRLFGLMDDEWRLLVQRRSGHCFPEDWSPVDWARICAAFALVLLAPAYLPRDQTRFCRALAVAGGLGLAGSWVAVAWPYALLLQGQPFRVLWLVQVLAFPLGFLLAVRLAAEERTFPQVVTLCLLYALSSNFEPSGKTALLLAGVFVLLVVCIRGLGTAPRHPQWLSLSAVGSVAAVFGLVLLLYVRSVAVEIPLLLEHFEPLLLVWSVLDALERPVLFLLVVGLTMLVLKRLGTGARLRVALAGVWLGYQGLLFGIGQWDAYCTRYRRDYANLVFVREALGDRLAAAGRPATVYWPTDLKYLWFDLHAHSYFNLMQTPGNIFHRRTAVVGDGRAGRVWKFDLYHLRTLPLTVRSWQLLARNYPAMPLHPSLDQEPAAPGREDLLRLCQDESLDYVVTLLPVGEDYLSTNGAVYVYDCARVRRKQHDEAACGSRPHDR